MIIKIADIENWLINEGIEYSIYGEKNNCICGFSSVKNYKEGTVTWMKNNDYANDSEHSISLCIVQKDIKCKAKTIIETPNSKRVFFGIIEQFFEKKEEENKIGFGTYIGSNVKIGNNVNIGSNCSIDGNIEIGDGTRIGNNVSIVNNVKIGKNCNIQSLVVIGEDGFGYSEDENHIKTMVKHHGGVEIGDNVFVGSHVNIARGTIDNTIIQDGVKIAPSTHIGHNSFIGNNATIICAWIFGSARIEDNAYIVSSVVRNQCSVGKNTLVGMGSVVTKSLPENVVAIGIPAKEKSEEK